MSVVEKPLVVRTLVVDDSQLFCKFIHEMFANHLNLQVIGEVADGLEAVHKAEELQPGLILLDMGLPTLNGIEAAPRIRKLSPDSKIIFVTQESSADVVQEALALGGRGYVLKARAATDLTVAVDAVLAGRQFISDGLLLPSA